MYKQMTLQIQEVDYDRRTETESKNERRLYEEKYCRFDNPIVFIHDDLMR